MMFVSNAAAAGAFPAAGGRGASASLAGNDFAGVLAATQMASAVVVTAPEAASKPDGAGDGGVLVDTLAGKQTIDSDDYFTPQPERGANSLHSLPPLLLPSAGNVLALSNDASAKLKTILAENNLPAGPAKITFDAFGQIQLPSDYADAERFKQALAAKPAVERELRAVNALAGHLASMQQSLPFIDEYEAAGSQSEANAVAAKYSYLFDNRRPMPKIELDFAPDGKLTVTADGKALRAA